MNPDERSDASGWNRRFALEAYAYGKEPNVWLAEEISKLGTVGRALFPADGEGRNAVWAAGLGWASDVFDLSEEGKVKCERLATHHGVSVNYDVDDLVVRSFEKEEYDLIACSWFHTPSAIRKKHMPRMLNALKPNGRFVMEGYHTSQMPLTSGGPKSMDLLFDLDEIVDELTGPLAPSMSVVTAEVVTTVLDESDLHRGEARVVRVHLVRTEDDQR